ncbi:MAG TPA: type IX secretion system membrane protein PorP/SprF [Crocinitomix sp.]|nr:type IX secretion system membrane protein PorP/SprF [Crocinitomix sp.]
MKKVILSVGVLLGCVINISAQQDKHFSMFYASKSQINPASAGFFEGDFQLFTNFRNQWTKVSDNPFRTFSGAFDTRIEAGNGFLGTGINFYNDVSGDTKYTVTQVIVPINYAIKLNRTSHLSFGLAPSFYQRSLKTTNVTWDSQWTGVDFNTGLNSGEAIPSQNLSVGKFDLGAGIYYQGDLSKYSWIAFGVSASHLTKQKINYFDIDNGLYRLLSFQAYGSFSQNNSNFTLKPSAIASWQGPNAYYVIGSGFDFMLKGNSLHTGYFQRTSIEFGTYFRVKDALILNAIFHSTGFSVGASFDLNVSTLNVATGGFGAMEFYLAYKIRKPRGLGAPSIH